jgi:3-methyladenine DNA glycosylase AlkD
LANTKYYKQFVAALKEIADPSRVEDISRYFHPDPNVGSNDNKTLGVNPGKVFPIAKQFVDMSLADIERLLDSSYYELRLGAVSIMDFQARSKSTTPEQRKALYDLYIRRHDRVNNWDLVDRAAPYVVGGYLADKSREVLYRLAGSRNPWERRTAIVSTYYFIRAGDVADTFGVAEILAKDKHELVQKAVGSWIREAGKRDQQQLVRFLEKHAGSMPRTMLRYAVEKLPVAQRAKFLG